MPAPLNKVERIKQEKDGLDVLADIYRYAETGYASIPEDDFDRFKWYGLYRQKPKTGHFMLRIKIPGGRLRAAQVRRLGEMTNRYARGFADITTRQDIQWHWLVIEDVPDVFRQLEEIGLTTTEACGDVVRNIVGCPVAGLDAAELIDATPVIDRLNRVFLGNKEFSNLPRKFKIAITGCPSDCAQSQIQDVGLTPARKRIDGRWATGFNVRAGGGLSSTPHVAPALDIFVDEDGAVEVCRIITEIFRDLGYREKRTHARLKFLVADWGPERFRAEIVRRAGHDFHRAGDESCVRWHGRDHVGVHRQKQPGLNYVGAIVPGGRLSGDDLIELARLAEAYGDGHVRLTVKQNFILTGVPDGRVERLLAEPLLRAFRPDAPAWVRDAVTCTGNQYCNLAVIETKQRILEYVRYLDEHAPMPDGERIRLHLTGCPNSCAQHHIADIGLQGAIAKVDGERVEAVDIYVGGGLGFLPADRAESPGAALIPPRRAGIGPHDGPAGAEPWTVDGEPVEMIRVDSPQVQGSSARYNRRIRRMVPADRAPALIANLTRAYLARRLPGESFQAFAWRHSDEELNAMLDGGGLPEARIERRAPEASVIR